MYEYRDFLLLSRMETFESYRLLADSHRLAYQSDYLEFFADNPFTDAVLLQITWNQFEAHCYKSTLLGKEPKYTICRESGTLALPTLLPLVRQVRDLRVSPIFTRSTEGRDGHGFILTLGDNFSQLTYRWFEVLIPDVWEQLETVGKDFLALQAGWTGKKRQHFRLTVEEEHTETGWSVWQNWREI